MHSTKNDILALLKRNDGSTVDELASSLNLAPMTVRQHLMALERDDLVRSEEVRRATGRPHYCFRLTGDGHRRVADGHDRLLALLVEEVGSLEPADIAATPGARRARLFRGAAARLAERYRGEMLALSGAAQMDRLVDILRAHGGFADWHEVDGGFELRDFACVYRATVGFGGPCDWHEAVLSLLIDSPARAGDALTDCAVCCRYIVSSRVTTPAPKLRASS
jgi:predicted ArsR family transcriptional regulator